MADYVPDIVCDSSGNFSSMTATGDGANAFDTNEEQEGTACLVCDKGAIAGTAYARKILGTDITSSDYFHIKFYHLFMKDYDFASPSAMGNNNVMDMFRMINVGFDKTLRLRLMNTNGASGKRNWAIYDMTGWTTFDPGWEVGVWRILDFYGYCHNTDGWLQLWENAASPSRILWAASSATDTDPGDDWRTVEVGITNTVAADRVCFAFDLIEVNDDASPVPPGTTKPNWYYERLRRA